MQFEDNIQQKAGAVDPSLSETWRELLGLSAETASGDMQQATSTSTGAEIPALTNDPWLALLRMQGIEIIDLQRVRMPALNDLEMDQALQLMQEQANPGSQEK
ncbi:MAG TPA: hypothetical protein VFQ30_06440 [Ktedonobacteraceae bacterium]|nr:hypothetical protein [Ktedonobacteraceae bacterium]